MEKSGVCPVHAGSADLAFPHTDIMQSFSRVRRHQLVIGADAWTSSCPWRHTAFDGVSSSDSEIPLAGAERVKRESVSLDQHYQQPHSHGSSSGASSVTPNGQQDDFAV